jgi:hypothetical protein
VRSPLRRLGHPPGGRRSRTGRIDGGETWNVRGHFTPLRRESHFEGDPLDDLGQLVGDEWFLPGAHAGP